MDTHLPRDYGTKQAFTGHSVAVGTLTTATARYRVEDGLLTVTYRGRSETTQLGGSPAEVLARIMLREMAEQKRED